MTARARLLLLAVALAATALVAQRQKSPVAAAAATSVPRPRPAPSLGPAPPVDPATIRDVFRFAERAAPPPVVRAAPEPKAPAVAAAPASELPKLVGLVRRQGRLLAAFAVDGDVVLAGAGDAVGGVSVLEVGEDGVRVRRKDGGEEQLRVP